MLGKIFTDAAVAEEFFAGACYFHGCCSYYRHKKTSHCGVLGWNRFVDSQALLEGMELMNVTAKVADILTLL
jgi:hypothetical protein